MDQNVRFYALIGAVVVVVGGLFFLIRGRGGEETPAAAPAETKQETARESREPMEAPQATGGRRESRFTAMASRPSAPQETTQSTKVGDYAISGQVTLQEDDSPVADADVSIYWTEKNAAIQTYDEDNVWKARTNNKGFFRVAKLPPSEYVLIAKKDDLAGVSGTAINTRETEDNIVNVQLRSVGTITGTVKNDKREPIPGALVALGQGKRGQRDIYGGNIQTKSGSDGSFELNYVDSGTWTVQAKADGYAVGQTSDVDANAQGVDIVLKKGGALTGTVSSVDTGKPVSNVDLVIRSSGRWSQLDTQKTTTDADGKFAFNDLADGDFSVGLDNQPYIVSGQLVPVKIASANTVDNYQINVLMGGSISGRATDAVTGTPIIGMAFRAQGGPGGRSGPAETDEDGVYHIIGLQGGNYTVHRMWMAGYRHGEEREDKPVTVQLGQEAAGVDFAVPPGLYLRGRVVDKNGEPLAMVDVTSDDGNRVEGESMVTDEKGRWVHRGFSPGTVVTITAEKAGYSAPPMENVTLPDHDLNDIEIVMDTGASIEGVVVDKAGEPLEEIYITAVASKPSSSNIRQQTAWSREGGKFKVQGLEEGTYTLQARPPRSWGQGKPTGNEVQVAKGENVTGVKIVVDFDSGTKIAGRVIDSSGQPIKGVNVNAYMPNGGGGGSAESDEDGKYQLIGLQEGVYWVQAYHQNYTNFRQESVEAPNPNFNITMRGKATISGRVLAAGSGQPIRTFSITAIPGEIQRISVGNYYGNGQTFVDDAGKFEIQVDDGGATLNVEAQGYAPATYPVGDTKEGQTKSGVEIRMETGGVVEGTVTTKSGERVAGARIYVGRAPMEWEVRNRPAAASTDANGVFRVESLQTGEEIRLFALHEQYATASASATPSAGGAPATVQIVMGSGGTITGTVRVAGKPSGGYGISVFYPDGGHQANTNVDGAGQYTFENLPEGTAMLNLYSNQGGGARRHVQKQAAVVSDQVTTVDFDVVEGTAVLEGVVTRGGQGVSGAYVSVSVRVEGDNQEGSNTQTDAKGAFRVEGMPQGSASVMVHAPDPSSGEQKMRRFQVELVNNQTTQLDANLDGGLRVNGTLSHIPQGWMGQATLVTGAFDVPADANPQEVFMGIRDRMAGATQVNTDGTFGFDGAEPGEYTVIGFAYEPQSGGQTYKIAAARVTVSEGSESTVNITLP